MENIIAEEVKDKEDLKDGTLVLKLNKAIDYEGKHIEYIDFRGFNDLTAYDLEEINKAYYLMEGTGQVYIETSVLWGQIAINRANPEYSIEMLKKISMQDAVRLKNRVSGFFYNLE